MAEDLVAIRMRLSGGKQVLAEGETAARGVAAPGAAAEASAAKTARASSSIRQSLTKQVSAMRTVGRGLSRFVTLPLLGVGVAAGAFAVDFDKAMRNVNSIAQLPEPAFKKLSNDVLALAGPTAQSPKTLAEGLYDLVSSGFDARESLIVLRKAALAATAGLTTTEVSTKAVAAVLNAYELPAKRAGFVSDVLFRTVDRGVLTFDELSSNIGKVIPFAASTGITLSELGAGIATLTKQGQSGAEAITFLKNTIVAFNKPSKDLKTAIKQTGFESGEALIKARGLQGALEAVSATTDGSRAQMSLLFPNIRAMAAVFGLTGGKAKAAAEDLRGFGDVAGATSRALSQQSQSDAFKMQKAWAELQVALIKLGREILPIVIPPFLALVHAAQQGLEWFSKLPKPARDLAGALLVLAATAGPLLLLSASMLKAAQTFGLLTGPITAKGMVGGLVKALPAAFAAAGVANIAISATKGEWEQAGFKAGGALVGGILGAPFGPAGIMVGAGLGSFVGGALGSKLQSHELSRVAASAQEATYWFGKQREASQGLAAASGRVGSAHARVRNTTQRLKTAQQHLTAVAQEYGFKSRATVRAEVRLTRAADAHRRALKRLENAERLRGTALSAYKTITNNTVLAERHRINILSDLATKQERAYLAARKHVPGSEREVKAAQALQGTLGKLAKATANHDQTLTEAAKKGGARYAKWLATADQKSIRLGGALKVLNLQVRGLTANFRRLSEVPPLPEAPDPLHPRPVFPDSQAPGGRPHRSAGSRRRTLGSFEPTKVRGAKLDRLSAGDRKRPPIVVPVYLNRRKIAEAVAEEEDDERARL